MTGCTSRHLAAAHMAPLPRDQVPILACGLPGTTADCSAGGKCKDGLNVKDGMCTKQCGDPWWDCCTGANKCKSKSLTCGPTNKCVDCGNKGQPVCKGANPLHSTIDGISLLRGEFSEPDTYQLVCIHKKSASAHRAKNNRNIWVFTIVQACRARCCRLHKRPRAYQRHLCQLWKYGPAYMCRCAQLCSAHL
jgi:hypothetical protein